MRKACVLLITFLLVSPLWHAQAQVVDILWQGDTYTPPFYKGRSLWSNQSRINLVAIPQGLGNPANLNYKWTKNGSVLGNASGLGRNVLSFSDNILSKPQIIKVDIISGEDTILASTSVTVAPVSPMLAVYENNPLYGFMFHRETSGGIHKIQGGEITFAAFPLFFDTLNRAENTVGYEWRTNVGDRETQNSVTYRVPENTTGSSEVQVRASSKDKITQNASGSFLVQFGNQ